MLCLDYSREDAMQQLDQSKLDAFLGRMIGDLGAVATGALVVLGDRLGLYKAMQAGDRMTAAELARRTGTHERYVREWLSAQAAAGYVEYDRDEDTFYLNAEQATVFADETARPSWRAASRGCLRSGLTSRRCRRRSAAARVWRGMTTAPACSAAPN